MGRRWVGCSGAARQNSLARAGSQDTRRQGQLGKNKLAQAGSKEKGAALGGGGVGCGGGGRGRWCLACSTRRRGPPPCGGRTAWPPLHGEGGGGGPRGGAFEWRAPGTPRCLLPPGPEQGRPAASTAGRGGDSPQVARSPLPAWRTRAREPSERRTVLARAAAIKRQPPHAAAAKRAQHLEQLAGPQARGDQEHQGRRPPCCGPRPPPCCARRCCYVLLACVVRRAGAALGRGAAAHSALRPGQRRRWADDQNRLLM